MKFELTHENGISETLPFIQISMSVSSLLTYWKFQIGDHLYCLYLAYRGFDLNGRHFRFRKTVLLPKEIRKVKEQSI